MQLLAGQGYWVLLVNPRGSTGYGHDFTFATRGRWGMEDYQDLIDRQSTRLNSSHDQISYAVFCLKKKNEPDDNLAYLRKYDRTQGHLPGTSETRSPAE